MKVYTDITQFKGVQFPVVTSGTFDGVHLGHQKIIHRLREIAKESNGETVILTFYPHPRMVLFPEDNELKLLNTQEEKIALLEKQGVDHLIIYPFTKKFSRLSSVNFIRDILVNKIGTKKLVIGYNHHFGRNREGSFGHLKTSGPVHGFEVEEIPAQDIETIEISSTQIRNALLEGRIKNANAFLGYSYILTGTVVKGKQIGRTFGYPTANIVLEDKYKLVPSNGIYVTRVTHGKDCYKGMMSIGFNPTVNGTERTIEVNILDFDKDIYGEKLEIGIVDKIRDEVKFDNLEDLKQKMDSDKKHTLLTFAKLNP